MSGIEQEMAGRFSGLKMLTWSVLLGCAGVAPLLLYIAFGPADGNPIGLGLLAVLAVPVSAVGAAVGLIKLLVERLRRKAE